MPSINLIYMTTVWINASFCQIREVMVGDTPIYLRDYAAAVHLLSIVAGLLFILAICLTDSSKKHSHLSQLIS